MTQELHLALSNVYVYMCVCIHTYVCMIFYMFSCEK